MASGRAAGQAGAVGVIGLGTMGGQIAGHLLAAGYRVLGRDTAPERVSALAVTAGSASAVGGPASSTEALASPDRGSASPAGGSPSAVGGPASPAGGSPSAVGGPACPAGGSAFSAAGSAAEVAASVDTIIVSLPSVAAFTDVAAELADAARPGLVIIEASTLPLGEKERARDLLGSRGAVLLDCPISGTGAQLRTKDVVVYASGDSAVLDRVTPVLAAFSRDVIGLGEFGNGTRLKLVANLLVAIHNVAAAEALLLAERAGLDPRAALAALTAGAGTSRMLEVRGPLMTEGAYGEATMAVRTFQKDLDIIAGFARDLECPLPAFGAAAQVHLAALAQGHGAEDTASVFAVLRRQAGAPAQSGPPAQAGSSVQADVPAR